MKTFSLMLCMLAFAGSAAAQTRPKTLDLGNIVSDSTSLNRDLGTMFGLPALGASGQVIEIRLYSNIGFPGAQCVVLQYDKAWKATKYKLNGKDRAPVKSTLAPASGIEPIVRSMIAANIFALPSQTALQPGSYQLDLATNELKQKGMGVSDGSCYHVQFKVGGNSREYNYCEPKAYAAFYKGQREYSDFVNILKAFARLDLK